MRDRNLSGNLEENSLGIRRRQRHLDDGVGKSVASPSRGSMLFEFGLGELAQIAHPVLIADSMYEDVEEHRPWDELAVGYTTFFGIVVIGGISIPQQRIYSVRSVVRQVDDTARRLLKITISLEHSLRARAERKQAEESRVPIPSPGRDTYLEVLTASLEKVRSETHDGLVYAPLVAIAGDDEIAVLSCDQQPAQFHRQLCALETR